MALQGKNGGVLAFPTTGLEQAIEVLKSCGIRKNEEINKLIAKMKYIIAVLKDAEKKQISSEADRLLLWELKQVVFDAEDLIDEFATDAAVQSMGAHTHNIPAMTPRMMGQICEINDRLVSLESRIAMLCLRLSTIQDSSRGFPTWRQTSSLLPDETSVIGRDREKEQIIEMLTQFDESSSNNNKGFSIVPIVGLGGVGKTTLAQLVYNDEKVKKYFELMMWVCVSNDFDPVRLTKDIIEAALASEGTYEQCQVNNWDSVQRRLLQEVEGKNFLLVLDDVWEAEPSVWSKLLIPLHFGKKGSKVLVTARNWTFVDKLEGQMETPIPLGGLSDDDIWVVFKKYAFRGHINVDGTTSAECSHLEDLGRCIVERLKGSPLAARTTGSLLNCELSVQHWKTVLESELWKLEQGEDDILPALLLSYQYLNADLKQCFAYCSLFPKGHWFSKRQVVQLWKVQSFIKKGRGTQMETTGSKYFDDLLHMSFFEPRGYSFVMHDLIHDLAEYVSKDDCFKLEDQKLVEIPDTVRHVSVCVGESGQIDIIKKLCCYEKLRTLRFVAWWYFDMNTNDLDQLFLKLKMLRVLELRHCMKLPGSIGDLKHLRYIDLQFNVLLENLPESLGNLYNLRVLILCYCWIRELPDSIGDLKHLRYLDMEGNFGLTRLPESLGNLYNLQVLNLSYCHSLRVLPATMSQLVSLRHLQTDDYKLVSSIDGVGKLTGLHKLQVRGRQVRELGGMCMLRRLAVYNLEEVGSKEEAIQARLHTMECLQVLQLEWSDRGPSSIKPELEEEVLQALRPNEGIQVLGIRGYGGVKSPDWMEVSTLLSSFSSLRCVSLHDCPNWQVPPCSFLGQLHHLEYLEIDGMPEWEVWSCPVSWDCLLELTIQDCPKLKKLPLLPPTLKSLSLNGVGISRVEEGVETTSSLNSPPTSASCDNLTSIGWLLQQQLPDLEEIEISVCEILVSLPEKGFGHLVSLKRLRITECPKLTCLLPMQEEEVASTQHLPCSLEELEIKECGDAMGGWWWAGLQRLTSIAKLSLCGCPTTAELLFLSMERHHHPHLPETLRELHIKECGCDNYEQELTTSSTCFSQLSPPPTLPPIPHNNVDASAGALRAFTSLKELSIWHSPNFLQKWGSCGLPSSLERLTIADDDSLSHEWLSACLHDLISLKALTLAHLENLQLLPNLSGVTSLESLEIESCPSMEMFEAMSLHSSLKTLTLTDCKDLRSLQNLSSLTSLETLLIQSCPSIQTLGLEVMSLHTSLKSLTLRHCENLHTLPDGTTLPSLETLEISNCRSIEMLEVMSRHTSLKSLTLKDCKNLHSLTNWSSFFSLVLQRLPENLHSLVLPLNDLQSLYISECPSLESLPDTLSYFSSLRTLKISHCPSIQTWPTNGLPSSLQTLQIINCPALTGRFKDKPKSRCAEVAHIPCVMIDGRRLQ